MVMVAVFGGDAGKLIADVDKEINQPRIKVAAAPFVNDGDRLFVAEGGLVHPL